MKKIRVKTDGLEQWDTTFLLISQKEIYYKAFTTEISKKNVMILTIKSTFPFTNCF